tara:strand:- start:138 stop:266 length:129 start_codon:yes stop_codon:yes gene_type:complete
MKRLLLALLAALILPAAFAAPIGMSKRFSKDLKALTQPSSIT